MLSNLQTLTQALDHHCQTHPEKTAIVMVNNLTDDDINRKLSYLQLRRSAFALAKRLKEDFPVGSRILLPTVVSEFFAIAFLACNYAKMIAVPSPLPGQYDHQRQRLSNIVKDANIRAVCHAPADTVVLKDWMSLEGFNLPLIKCQVSCDETLFNSEVSKSVSGELALLQYTSGSTGLPKGVMLTHDNLYQNVSSFQRTLKFSDATVFGGWIPQYHDMGLMAQLVPALFLGSTCHMMTPNQFLRRPLRWLKMIERFGVSHTCAPNFAFDYCSKRIADEDLEALDISSLQYLINGSEPIQADTLDAFAKKFAAAGLSTTAIQPCYGMAECTVFISGAGPRKPIVLTANRKALQAHRFKPEQDPSKSQRLVSCGTALDYEVRIADTLKHHRLDEGQIGEIWLSGASVALGFWENPKATQANFCAHLTDGEGPFLKTGDLGFLWQNELFITGRLKEVIIANGKNLYPQDIEHGLRQQFPELRGKFGAAFGLSREDHSETIGICHELQGTYDLADLEDLSAKIRQEVNQQWGAPVSMVTLLCSGDIDRTTSGKIQRAKVKERFLNQSLKIRHQWVCETIKSQMVSVDTLEEETGV